MANPDPYWMDPDEEEALLLAADRRRREFARLQQQVFANPGLGARVVANTQRAPWASPGTVTGASIAGVEGEQFDQIAALDDGGQSDWFGRATAAVTGAIDDVGEALYEQVIKPVVRGAFLITDTLAQEVIQRPITAASAALAGDADSFGDAYRDYGNSAGVIAARNLLNDDPNRSGMEELKADLNLGKGFFAGGAIGEEEQAQRTLTIDGQRATFGLAMPQSRMAGVLFGNGSKAHDVVAGITQFAADVLLDPAAWVTGGSKVGASVVRRAVGEAVDIGGGQIVRTSRAADIIEGGISGAIKRGKTLDPEEAAELLRQHSGGLSTSRQSTVLVEKAEQFFKERALLEKLAESDAYTIHQSFRRSRRNTPGVDMELMHRLGAAKTTDQVAEVLLRAVADTKIRERGLITGVAGQIGLRPWIRDHRFAGISTRGIISADNMDDAAEKLDTFMRQSRLDRDTRAKYFNEIVQVAATSGDKQRDLFEVTKKVMKKVDAELGTKVHGQYTKIIQEYSDAFRAYAIDNFGDAIYHPFVRSFKDPDTGKDVFLPTPQLMNEMGSMAFHLPDASDIRRAAHKTALARKVFQSKTWDWTEDTARWITESVFKPAAILRPAYVIRIGLEEQARLAAAGYDSLFNHPFRWLMGNVVNGKAMTDMHGVSLWERAKAMQAITRDATAILADRRFSRTNLWGIVHKGGPAEGLSREYVRGWRNELAQLAGAEEAQALISFSGDLDAFVAWARGPEGVRVLERISKVNQEAAALLTSDRAVREWGASIWKRVEVKTRLNDRILDAIQDPDSLLDPRRVKQMDDWLAEQYDLAPNVVKIEHAAKDSARAAKSHMDEALNKLFYAFTGWPTSKFARYPVFRQSMIRNTEELLGAVKSDEVRREILESLGAGLNATKDEQARLGRAFVKAQGAEGLIESLDDFNDLLIMRASQEVKDLLFDTTRRSAAQDQFVVAAPFLDAWREVTQSWARLVKENPGFFIRGQAGYQSAGEQGVFYTNDFDEEVFAYPGGGMLTKLIAPGLDSDEASLRLEGRVQGLNLVAQGIGPGFGPVVQWMAGSFLPDTPDFQTLRGFISPFGTPVDTPADLADPGTFLTALMPAWLRKTVNGLQKGKLDEVQWNSTVGDAMKALATSGEYDMSRPEEQQRLLRDAEKAGRWVLFIRSAVQGFGPTGPGGVWQIKGEAPIDMPDGWDPEKDPDGVWHSIGEYAKEWRRLRQQYGDDELASARFIGLYGIEPFYVGQAKTRSIREAPVSEEGSSWMARHRDLAHTYERTLGFFAPIGAEDEFDYGVYRDQIERGDRQSLNPKQQLELANQVKARMLYTAAKKRLQGMKGANDYLRTIRSELDDKYPNWQFQVLGVEGNATNSQKITELERAVQDPRLADNPLTRPLKAYFQARDQMFAVAESRGMASLNNQASGDLREALLSVGEQLSERSPEFRTVWQQVLLREVDV